MQSENQDIRYTTSIDEIVQCVNSGKYGETPLQVIKFFDDLPATPYYDYFRTLAVPYLFNSFEENIHNDQEPGIWLKKKLLTLRDYVEELHNLKALNALVKTLFENNSVEYFEKEVKAHTGKHYGNLFKDFNHISYFVEAKELLEIRLKKNKIGVPNLEDCRLLDQGCGGGRYTAAWKLLGVGEAVGLDYSKTGLEDARERIARAGIEDVSFKHGSVLDMPFKNDSFDIVFSNGVLHHTENWEQGVAEQLRVLKEGGYGWLYLIEKPGGAFWDKIEILRAIMKGVEKSFAQRILKSFNIPANRIFYMLDHVMVPINTRLTPARIESVLQKHGACSIQRLKRGNSFDRIEYLHKKIPYAEEKFGVGENRYLFRKA